MKRADSLKYQQQASKLQSSCFNFLILPLWRSISFCRRSISFLWWSISSSWCFLSISICSFSFCLQTERRKIKRFRILCIRTNIKFYGFLPEVPLFLCNCSFSKRTPCLPNGASSTTTFPCSLAQLPKLK